MELALSQVEESNNKSAQANQPDKLLTYKTFEILEGLHKNSTKVYDKHKEEIETFVRQPFKDIFQGVGQRLPQIILTEMDIEKKFVFKILKNNFGQCGGLDYYWGAFYPKNTNNIQNAQLYITLNGYEMISGFRIGKYGQEKHRFFKNNFLKNQSILEVLLASFWKDMSLMFGRLKLDSVREWLTKTDELNSEWYRVNMVLTKEEVLQLTSEELIQKIVNVFKKLFPLVLLTIYTEPMPKIEEYMNELGLSLSKAMIAQQNQVTLQPEYSLNQVSQKTKIEESELLRYIKAIERKKQVIFVGASGTVKTFLAQELAKHLISNTYGESELIQFHPAYCYEDFMQGIRPMTNENGTLTYKIIPERFLNFCEKAREKAKIILMF